MRFQLRVQYNVVAVVRFKCHRRESTCWHNMVRFTICICTDDELLRWLGVNLQSADRGKYVTNKVDVNFSTWKTNQLQIVHYSMKHSYVEMIAMWGRSGKSNIVRKILQKSRRGRRSGGGESLLKIMSSSEKRERKVVTRRRFSSFALLNKLNERRNTSHYRSESSWILSALENHVLSASFSVEIFYWFLITSESLCFSLSMENRCTVHEMSKKKRWKVWNFSFWPSQQLLRFFHNMGGRFNGEIKRK